MMLDMFLRIMTSVIVSRKDKELLIQTNNENGLPCQFRFDHLKTDLLLVWCRVQIDKRRYCGTRLPGANG
jgi:hypothetical protein